MKTLILVNSTLLFILSCIAVAVANDDRTARRYTSTPLQISKISLEKRLLLSENSSGKHRYAVQFLPQKHNKK